MNNDDIIQLALEHFGAVLKPSDLEVQLAVLAVTTEREACAKVCDEFEDAGHAQWDRLADSEAQGKAIASADCAAAIRARREMKQENQNAE